MFDTDVFHARHPRGLLHLGLLLTALGASLAAAPAAEAAKDRRCKHTLATPGEVTDRTLVRATHCLLNQERRARRLRKLRLNGRLSRAALLHARDMARRNYFSHESLTGASFLDRIKRTGYLRTADSWSVGENIAWGSGRYSTPRAIVRSWMQSPGHRANVLQPRFRERGIGVVRASPHGSSHAATYAAEFGKRY